MTRPDTDDRWTTIEQHSDFENVETCPECGEHRIAMESRRSWLVDKPGTDERETVPTITREWWCVDCHVTILEEWREHEDESGR